MHSEVSVLCTAAVYNLQLAGDCGGFALTACESLLALLLCYHLSDRAYLGVNMHAVSILQFGAA